MTIQELGTARQASYGRSCSSSTAAARSRPPRRHPGQVSGTPIDNPTSSPIAQAYGMHAEAVEVAPSGRLRAGHGVADQQPAPPHACRDVDPVGSSIRPAPDLIATSASGCRRPDSWREVRVGEQSLGRVVQNDTPGLQNQPRSAIDSAMLAFCSTMKMRHPLRGSAGSVRSWSGRARRSPIDGSSINNEGLAIKKRPMATICFSPPDGCRTSDSAHSFTREHRRCAQGRLRCRPCRCEDMPELEILLDGKTLKEPPILRNHRDASLDRYDVG